MSVYATLLVANNCYIHQYENAFEEKYKGNQAYCF